MRPFTTPDQLLKRVPGYKGAENKPSVGPDGELIAFIPSDGVSKREPLLPEIENYGAFISKDATDYNR